MAAVRLAVGQIGFESVNFGRSSREKNPQPAMGRRLPVGGFGEKCARLDDTVSLPLTGKWHNPLRAAAKEAGLILNSSAVEPSRLGSAC